MPKNKRLQPALLYGIIVLSVTANTFFAAIVALDINVTRGLVKLREILTPTGIPERLDNVPGRWRLVRTEDSEQPLTARQKEMIKKLESVGYLAGSKPDAQAESVTVYNKELAFNGFNLIVSGHGP